MTREHPTCPCAAVRPAPPPPPYCSPGPPLAWLPQPRPPPPRSSPAAADALPVVRFVDIAGDGGTVLKANAFTPAGADGSRTYPVIVLPTSWAMPQIEYAAQAKKLADSGYVVVSYNSRGFWQSGGNIEVAGPPDIADDSKVIDWALANTPADPANVGMAGVSYGAGISLLAAGHDKRIKAVAAPDRPTRRADRSVALLKCGLSSGDNQTAGHLGQLSQLPRRPGGSSPDGHGLSNSPE